MTAPDPRLFGLDAAHVIAGRWDGTTAVFDVWSCAAAGEERFDDRGVRERHEVRHRDSRRFAASASHQGAR